MKKKSRNEKDAKAKDEVQGPKNMAPVLSEEQVSLIVIGKQAKEIAILKSIVEQLTRQNKALQEKLAGVGG